MLTGAGGFIGQALAAALVKEAKAAPITLTDVVELAAPNPIRRLFVVYQVIWPLWRCEEICGGF